MSPLVMSEGIRRLTGTRIASTTCRCQSTIKPLHLPGLHDWPGLPNIRRRGVQTVCDGPQRDLLQVRGCIRDGDRGGQDGCEAGLLKRIRRHNDVG